MNAPISNPADCEAQGVIRFLQAENVRPSEIHALKQKWTASFERIDVSQLAKCTNNVRKCLVQLYTKLSPNIRNTTKFVHVGPGGLLVNKYK